MFYSKKYLFFIIAYLMISILSFFIYKQFSFLGIDINLILGSVAIYASILICSLCCATVLVYLFKFFKLVFKSKSKIATNFLWNVFTWTVYLIIFIIFIKGMQY
jgi:hypothetical protein